MAVVVNINRWNLSQMGDDPCKMMEKQKVA